MNETGDMKVAYLLPGFACFSTLYVVLQMLPAVCATKVKVYFTHAL